MTNQVQDVQAHTLEHILDDGLSPADERVAIEQFLRDKPTLATPLLFSALAQKHRLRALLEETNKALREPPWHPAAFLSLSADETRALVACGTRRLSVALAPDIDRCALRCGDPVFLNGHQNVLMALGQSGFRPGVVGEFSRGHRDGQGVIRGQGESEIVVDLAARILERGIQQGDRVLYDPEHYVAYDTLEKHEQSTLLEQLPLNVRISDLGGLDEVFNELVSEVTLQLFHTDLVHRYALKPTKGVLLCGPPGTGKTSLVQALGEHLGREMGVDITAFLVRPGVHRSMWFGASEQRVRDLFQEARRAAESGDRYVLLFFDDMDHLGSRDQRVAGDVDARLLPCFLQEIDAVRTHRMLLLGATNRDDLLDEALLRPGRFGRTFRIGRPSRSQAREIFRRYLTADLPVRQNGHGGTDAIHHLIEDLLSALYAPNGEFARLAMLTFRDGSRVPLSAGQILSGALIAASIEQGKRRGCFRALEGGPGDVDATDLRSALRRELFAICARLKPGVALQQMLDLPPDRDVVKVEPCMPEDQPRRATYLNESWI
jgi:proteasome-associated ATPase